MNSAPKLFEVLPVPAHQTIDYWKKKNQDLCEMNDRDHAKLLSAQRMNLEQTEALIHAKEELAKLNRQMDRLFKAFVSEKKRNGYTDGEARDWVYSQLRDEP